MFTRAGNKCLIVLLLQEQVTEVNRIFCLLFTRTGDKGFIELLSFVYRNIELLYFVYRNR